MINMDQVRTLEMKVKQTVQLIVHLRRENDSLRGRLSDTEVKLEELEALLEGLKASQTEMESGIRSALQELDHLDESDPPETASPEPVAETADLATEQVELVEASHDEIELEASAFDEASDEDLMSEPDAAELDEPLLEDEPEVEVEASDEAETTEPEAQPQQPGLGIF